MFTLGRKVSLTYRTNQIILGLAVISGILWYIVTTDLAESAMLAGSLFLSWALVREIDCRREYAAFVAVGIYIVLQLFFSFQISLGLIFLMILLMRAINQITGKSLTAIDLLSVIGLTGYLIYTTENGVYLLLVILMLVVNAYLNNNGQRNSYLALIVTAMTIVISLFTPISLNINSLATEPLALVHYASLLVYFIYILIDKDKASVTDLGEPASIRRLLYAQLFYGLAQVVLIIFGDMLMSNRLMFISSALGVVIYGLIDQYKKKQENE
ncbi:hypothetical protein SAMN05421839_11159 [Halolactibacillus halophilus]|uniref:Uncharacterized protein n=1 Tax=Halolactibacillus halophilus TaxID=306540 RepID=A0A1I5NW66_9BACI|nr:hypothetical protein [Halolactibacillus halophilus]GEM01475.1 hypothetical protein HHA03_10070 [Halolactibacillus halophilus]SFP26035.1 hypothetical protein SAMN05421839_11159 [Halolactibacillus halophilus]